MIHPRVSPTLLMRSRIKVFISAQNEAGRITTWASIPVLVHHISARCGTRIVRCRYFQWGTVNGVNHSAHRYTKADVDFRWKGYHHKWW